ncbi:MAG TPA: DNA-formamidopyrimidine glycosylase family protein [Jiangellales bacterium]|nr:DNA-formamidopyrimidine glycosylase family protein [Jiangellales bacterium]
MPEGDTVWLAGQRLHDALGGGVLLRSDFRVPRYATVDLTGRSVLEVVSRGKHLLTRVTGGTTIHTHFRMDGSWHLYRPGRRWTGGPAWQVRVVLATADWEAVGYRLPVVDVVPTAREGELVGHLGPDLLGPDWDPAEASRRLAADPRRAVGEALLDQRVMAGIGNLYRTEMCFLLGVTPWVPVGDLPGTRAAVDLGHRLLEANKGTVEQVTTGDRSRGRWHWVFERRECLRCGTRVATALQGDPATARISYWCPRCQLGPAPPSRPVSELRGPRPAGRTRYRP